MKTMLFWGRWRVTVPFPDGVEYFAMGIVKFTGTWKYAESLSVPCV